ncbi:hypothetical protein KPSA1_06888 [Pseudomonas syringae pv. actinidiae]|uniref:Uncharacterized protein n=1 Tax=Pseudomonas syringae pv. actinidiae TaxID=103796 RepID=A0A2V0QXP6_PSESF|nr:hypothetical protein KPSA1_06888 [Pseudomonas syringae pv. actinidiae]
MIKTTNPSLTASTIEISKNKSTIYALPSRNKKTIQLSGNLLGKK